MTFVKSIKSLFPGYGHATSYGAALNVNTAINATTININTNTAASNATVTMMSQAISNGLIRVRTNVVGVNATAKITSITATDGTTTVQIYGGDSNASGAGVGIDEIFEFCTNLSLTTFSVVVNCQTNNCAHDVEVAGNL